MPFQRMRETASLLFLIVVADLRQSSGRPNPPITDDVRGQGTAIGAVHVQISGGFEGARQPHAGINPPSWSGAEQEKKDSTPLNSSEIAECQALVPAFQWPDDVICRQHTATVFYCQCRLVFEARVKASDPYPTLRAGPSYDQLQPYERNIVAIYCMRRGQGMPDSPDSSSVFWNGAVACPKPVKKRADSTDPLVRCGNFPHISHAYVSSTSVSKGLAYATYSCQQGYKMQGLPVMRCRRQQRWRLLDKRNGPRCQQAACTSFQEDRLHEMKSLQPYLVILNSTAVALVNESLHFACSGRHEIQGSDRLTCVDRPDEGPVWDADIPRCEAPPSCSTNQFEDAGLLVTGYRPSRHGSDIPFQVAGTIKAGQHITIQCPEPQRWKRTQSSWRSNRETLTVERSGWVRVHCYGNERWSIAPRAAIDMLSCQGGHDTPEDDEEGGEENDEEEAEERG
ncbi:uncharacterized protein LOC135819780 [Sycon ciliatum]|uniref:uncharacterized protein LOC135819780 n=1 Tax=Sycon ciliatum TaxID=27933 RepID=UPI0031F697C5